MKKSYNKKKPFYSCLGIFFLLSLFLSSFGCESFILPKKESKGDVAQNLGSQTYKIGDPEPTAPTQAGKAFLGWYKNDNFANINNRVDFDNPPAGTNTIYPKFVDDTGYTIDKNGVLTQVPESTIEETYSYSYYDKEKNLVEKDKINTVEIPYNVNQITVKKIKGLKTNARMNIFGVSSSDVIEEKAIEKIYLPTLGLEEIGKSTFIFLSNLRRIKIPNTVTAIGVEAFYSTGLDAITLPNKLESLGENAFHNVKLTSITIPASVTSIGRFAFGYGAPGGLVSSFLKIIKVEAIKPPTAAIRIFSEPTRSDLKIIVPDRSAAAVYKLADGWEYYASKIVVAVNLAQGKHTAQKKTDYNGVSSNAVDGNTDGNWFNGSVTHTAKLNQPWWKLDLGNLAAITDIKIFNRTDCCSWRLNNYYVFVSDSPISDESAIDIRSQSGVTTYHITENRRLSTIPVNLSGRYIRIQLDESSSEYLSLAEVQVFGSFIYDTTTTRE